MWSPSLTADVSAIPAQVWGIIGALLTGYGGIVAYLIRRDNERERQKEQLYEKLFTQVIPALERATAAAQGFPPILERNAAAMGQIVDASAEMKLATAQVVTLIAVLSDRQARDPGPSRQ